MMSENPPDQGPHIFVPADSTQPSAPPMSRAESSDVIQRIPGLPKVTEAVANVDMTQVVAKVESLKKWTVGTFKNSRQQILEHMGKADKTIDPDFEERCEFLKDLHRRYGLVVVSSRQLSAALTQLASAEKSLAESLYQLSLKEDSIRSQCTTTSDSMRKVGDAATNLENCLRYFLSSMETLHGKTITDTLETIYSTEAARIEFDVKRHELATIQNNVAASPDTIAIATEHCERHREKYEQFKDDVRVKLRLLEENRVGVMARQLEKLQSALVAYYSGNAQLLANALEELAAISAPTQQSFLQ